MAIKLSQATWSAFAKGRGLEDAALAKALATLDRSDPTRPIQCPLARAHGA